MAPIWARLDGVLQLVLAVRGAELQAADHFDDLGMEAGHARLVGRRLALLVDLLLDLLLRLGDDLFDARRMDAPILDQFGQREPSDLAAYRIETRQRDGVGRVVDDQVDPGHGFERADVAPLAADDAALHLLVRNLHDGGGDLADGIAGVALDRHGQDLARLCLGALARLHLDQSSAARGFVTHLLLDALQEQRARFVAGERGHVFDRRDLIAAQLFDLAHARIGLFLALLESALTALLLLHFAIEVFFFLAQSPLLRLELDAHFARLVLGSGSGANRLLFGFEEDGFLFSIRVGADFTSALFGQHALVIRSALFQDVAQPKADDGN